MGQNFAVLRFAAFCQKSNAAFGRESYLMRQKLCQFVLYLALAAGGTFLPSSSQAQTFKAVPLDGGGHLSGFAQSQGRIYAYGDVFGAWRTDNGGNNWTYLNWDIPGGDVVGYAMAAQQDNADVVYYSSGSALYKSIDGGTNWNKLLGDLNWYAQDGYYQRVRGATHLVINSGNSQELWLASPRTVENNGTLWKSSNGGTSWNKMGGGTFEAGTNRALTVFQSVIYPSHIWVGTEKGLYVTNNGGTSFQKVTSDVNVGMIKQFSTGTYAGVLLINRGPFCCSDNGVTRITSTNYNDITKYTGSIPTQVNLGYPTGLQIFSDNTATAWNTGGDVQGFSTDGGQTFVRRNTTLNTTNVPIWTTAAAMDAKDHPDYGTDQVIQVGNDPNTWMITGGGAIMKTTDKGLTWSYLPNGSGIAAVKTYLSGVSRYDADRMYITASDIGSAIVTDGGASGTATYSSNKSFNGLHSTFRIMEGQSAQNLVLAGTNQGASSNLIMKSSDGGASWNTLNLSSSGLPASSDGIAKSVMSFTDANDYLVVLAESGTPAQRVYRTTNGGVSFSPVAGLPDNMPTGGRYGPQNAFIERDATDAKVRYFVARGQQFYKSTNSGANWSPTANRPFGGDWVWGLVADPIRSGNLWAAGDDAGIKYTTNGGDTWTATAKYFKAKYVAAYNGKIAIWGQEANDPVQRLWYSDDNGTTWSVQTTADKNFHGVQGITVDSKGKIWVSWNSVTVVTPSSLITEVSDATLENSTSIYPNPTQGIVSLKIENDDQGLHTVAIYNVAGQKLATSQVMKTSYTFEVPVNLSAFPSGVYYIETINTHSRSFKKVAKY
ncbi:MAG TPA: T9SS type A sorting domain-containing protein [Cytophagaceae bacterium]|jgi:hypothetical protein